MAVFAQPEIQVQGSSPDLYLSHTIVAKETWFSIGRMYNLAPKEIAAYNKSNLTEVLKLGQVLKIPLTVDNFSQDGQRAADEVFVPVKYTVQPKEWMYRISQNHNKVPIETLESWNSVKNDELRVGMNLIVGYLKVRTGQSPLASRGSKKIVGAPVAKNDKQVEADKKPGEKKTEVFANNDTKVAANDTKPATQPTTQPTTQSTTPPQPKTTPAPVENIPTSNTETWSGYKGGYFKNTYSEKGTNTTGNAGIFRSTSGWKDGKYYALINEVPTGTIIKVTFPTTNKSVFAKVLGPLPEMRESAGLKLRLSDAAAAELGADIGKFYVDVKY
jgi:LysM repeat protein